jgi:hypothetical protein
MRSIRNKEEEKEKMDERGWGDHCTSDERREHNEQGRSQGSILFGMRLVACLRHFCDLFLAYDVMSLCVSRRARKIRAQNEWIYSVVCRISSWFSKIA